ncbi:unnamed protein product [Leptidea sinapis]|uniref:C2H2-type domain-containing protein n=1 Tax=Leptidea sinapis TaxID=189913 RepID=A0A5E4Q357_9NEOP|nr:unnamed protein product [Leptidea sinapis]
MQPIIEEKVPDLMPAESDFLETTINELSEKYEKSDPRINSSTIKIKTKFALKDPQVAAFNPKIESLIQQAIKGQMITFSEEDAVKETDSVIQQLLRVPAFKPAVLERNLIITKVVIEDNNDGVKECEPVILPGRVVKGKEDTWVFQYISDMLQKINKDEINKKHKGGSNDINFLQIHVQEVTVDNEVARASISLHKRIILLKPKNIAQKVKVKEETQSAPKMQRKYACGACVQSFDTEYRLRVHQQVHCKERNDVRPLSAEQDVSYKMIKIRTVKLNAIQRHVKCHLGAEAVVTPSTGSSLVEGGGRPHRCRMCSVTYLHAATLSKHILTKHIKVMKQDGGSLQQDPLF